jgi:hypothetical protein
MFSWRKVKTCRLENITAHPEIDPHKYDQLILAKATQKKKA